jgi:Fanconi anemia group M protein
MIVIDKREKNSLVVSELVNKKHEIKLELLNVADYIVGDVAIERKTMSDFISSMINKRLVRQLHDLKQHKKQLLIIEKDTNDIGKLHPNAIRGMLLAILFDFKVPIIFTKDYEETADFLILLDKKQNKKPSEISLKAKRKANNLQEQQQIILEGFPGIGPKTAKTLLNRFKTIKKIVNAEDKELEKILNKKQVDSVKRIVSFPYIS